MELFHALILSLLANAWGTDRPVSPVPNGGMETPAGWTVTSGGLAEEGNPGRCLRIAGPGGATLLVIPTGPSYPAAARLATVEFLRRGGSFLATGG